MMMGGFEQLWSGGMGMVFGWGIAIALVIVGARLLFPGRESRQEHPDESPLDIAQERYAAGEIDRDEYLDILADIELTDELAQKPKRDRLT